MLITARSLGGEVDVACSGMASGASELEVNPFSGRVVGLGILGGQPARETIAFAAVRAGGYFGLSVDIQLFYQMSQYQIFSLIYLRNKSERNGFAQFTDAILNAVYIHRPHDAPRSPCTVITTEQLGTPL